MAIVVVHGIDASVTSLGSPTYAQINDALSSIQLWGVAGEVGGWVGPRPRVVRIINTGAPRGWLVHFAWPYQWPDDAANDARYRTQLLDAVRRQLAPTSADWTVTLEPYTPAVNGPIADWQSGALSVTQTADIWPTLGGRLDAQENPIGPTTAGTHPGTLAGAAGAGVDKLTDFLKSLWPLAALGVGVFIADKVGAFTRKPPPRQRQAKPKRERAQVVPLDQWDPFRLPPGARSNPDYSNPRPPEWGQYAPSTPYPCHPYESKVLGLVVPGRGGGTVSSCATPAEPVTAKRRRGQVQIGLPGVGAVMPKSRARARIRRAGMEVLRTPIEDVAQAVDAYNRASCPLPYAPGLEFPHLVSRCDPEHKIWKGYADALADAQERASIEAPENASASEFDCFVRGALAEHPKFPEWDAAAAACARAFVSRESGRRGKAAFSTQRERGQARARAIASGEDVTGAEYRDTLRSAERKGRRNYEHQVNALLEKAVRNFDVSPTDAREVVVPWRRRR